MSQKRQVQSSILSFFKKSPSVSSPTTQNVLLDTQKESPSVKAKRKLKDDKDIKVISKPDSPVVKKRRTRIKSSYDLFSDDDEEEKAKTTEESSSEDDEDDKDPDFKVDPKQDDDEDDDDDEEEANISSETVDENEEPMVVSDELSDEDTTPVKSRGKSRKIGSAKSKSSTRKAFQFTPKSATAKAKSAEVDSPSLSSQQWPPKDDSYSFLFEENIRDIERRRPDHPDYDATTLYVPQAFLNKQTGCQKQWWEIKSKHYDTILFFKVGKFYELFHMDGLIGIKELNLLPMGGSYTHSGFPEKSFTKFADILREKGYKVARVEQTESNEARDARIKSSGRSGEPNVVRREICQIITPGTSCFSTEVNFSAPRLLMAIYQKNNGSGPLLFGVAFLDSTVAKFTLSEFSDDKYCSRFRTLLAYNRPIEILVEKNNLSPEANFVLDTWYKGVQRRVLVPNKQFLDARSTLELIKSRSYFTEMQIDEYPDALKLLCDEEDSTMLTPSAKYINATRALGALLWYIKDCLIDEEIVSMGKFQFYHPPDEHISTSVNENSRQLPSNMIMDASTLAHLDILDSELGVKYSLLGFLDHTCTKFGKRLFRSWVCSPLTDVQSINNRLDAIEDLEKVLSKHKHLFTPLSSLTDLEKSLTLIHKIGIKRKDHPDDRAQMFEDYDKKKVKCLLQSLDALKKIVQIVSKFEPYVSSFKSDDLKKILTQVSNGGMFPDLEETIDNFEACIDLEEAKKSYIIIPSGEWDPALVEVNSKINKVEDQLEKLRKFYTNKFGSNVKYSHTKKDRYLIEVKKNCSKLNDNQFRLVNSTKTVSRYSCREVQDLAQKLKDFEDEKEVLAGDTKRKLFAKFSKYTPLFMQAVNCIAILDCCLSLTKAKSQISSFTNKVSRPVIEKSDANEVFIEVVEGKHPILMQLNDNFIPNTLTLHGEKMVILTGPNMGGKSTLMRQTALLAIMAQIGSYVPASSVKLTLVDRVFTRIGAYDNISAGDSTFKVEMDEASAIVKHATIDSLILMDELGRGTSTHDGTAIAHAVVKYLSSNLKCRTLFSTHYHDLIGGLDETVNIQPLHMKCIEQKDSTTGQEEIIFLYKVAPGECPKSHGFNAARLAGLPEQLISIAKKKAKEMHQDAEITSNIRTILKQVKESNPNQLRLLLRKLKLCA